MSGRGLEDLGVGIGEADAKAISVASVRIAFMLCSGDPQEIICNGRCRRKMIFVIRVGRDV